MEKVWSFISLLPILLTFYLGFFQTQQLWLKKNFLWYGIICLVFGILWVYLPFIPVNNRKLFAAPLAWVLSCYIGQLIHKNFAAPQNKCKPIVFVVYDTVIGKYFYNKSLHQKPTILDLFISGLAIVGPVLILLLTSSWINQFFDQFSKTWQN
jgi:hypothetical protein